MTQPIATPSASRPRRRWRLGAALAAAFIAGGVALPALTATAQDAAMHHMMGGPGHGGMQAAAMVHIGKLLDQVGASAEQKSRIHTVLQAGLAPMAGLHDEMGQTHARLHALLAAPTIDRGALEQLRVGEIARLDQVSHTVVQAIADAAEVLTPEQRARLATLMTKPHDPA